MILPFAFYGLTFLVYLSTTNLPDFIEKESNNFESIAII